MTRPVTFLGLISTNIVSMDSINQGIYKFELLPHYHLPLLSVLLGWRPYFLADYSLLKNSIGPGTERRPTCLLTNLIYPINPCRFIQFPFSKSCMALSSRFKQVDAE